MESSALSSVKLPTLEPSEDTVGNQELGRDEFLKLLITQLENQDPLDPQDATEFTAQLAQFSTLEQLVSIRSAIEALGTGEAAGVAELSGLIGREVTANATQLELGPAGSALPGLAVSLPFAATEVRVDLLDGSGRVVRRLEIDRAVQGHNAIDWDGLDENALPLPPGIYGLRAEALNDSATVPVETLVSGRVTSVLPGRNGDGGSVMLGAVPIPLAEISEVREAGAGS